MGDVAFFYPPAYQRAPAGSEDALTTGANGKPGAPGKDGQGVLTGSVPPVDSLGRDGESYIQLSSDGEALVYWGPKKDGHWPTSGVSMLGAAGSPGLDAPFPISGDGPPDPANVGRPGQIYLDKLNAQLFLAEA